MRARARMVGQGKGWSLERLHLCFHRPIKILLRAIPFWVIFFLFFLYLILSHSFIAFAPSDLADSDHPDSIPWPHLLSSIGYEDTDSLSSGKPMDNPHALCHMPISSL